MKEMNQTTELISGFRRGSLQAVRNLHTTYYTSLLYFAERIIRDRVSAREIVIETFIKLLNRRSYFDNQADIKAFLFITARNACMDFLRHVKNGRLVEETAKAAPETELDLANEVNSAEAKRVMQEALDGLPAICQQVFTTLFIEGAQTSAAARQLEIDPRELLMYRKKSINQLQAALAEHNLFSTPFFIHYLTVACRKTVTAVKLPVTVNR
jgi:RNA polymerase sigma-70 factor (ECF subfamily)